MKNNTPQNLDYQIELLTLIKSKFPSFLLGLCISTYLSVFILGKIGIGSQMAKTKVDKTFPLGAIKTYTVLPNDDLWGIAQKMYGSGFNAEDIAAANNLVEPYTLIENQILIIPSIASKQPTKGDITQTAASTKKIKEYTVLPGDYLWQIAEKVYGDGNQMSKLIEGNNIPYPYNVEEGQKLLIP